jgi:threonine dehydrogenase-like Zn-dependent dehydrogenase
VTSVTTGDRVIVAFDIACGTCWFCRRGETQLCDRAAALGAGTFGGDLAGAQAELVRVPFADVNLLPVPEGLDDERALFVGDVLTTGFYAASIAGVGPDDTVAVIGMGPVGYFAAQAARALGAGAVYALDLDADRLALAERIGAIAVDVTARHPATALAEATGGRGADVVIEAVGSPTAFESAVNVVRRGGRVVVVGVYAGETIEMQLGVYWARALELRFVGLCPVHAWWDRALAAVVAGTIDPLPLISHRLPLEDAARGYELFDRREATKVVLTP